MEGRPKQKWRILVSRFFSAFNVFVDNPSRDEAKDMCHDQQQDILLLKLLICLYSVTFYTLLQPWEKELGNSEHPCPLLEVPSLKYLPGETKKNLGKPESGWSAKVELETTPFPGCLTWNNGRNYLLGHGGWITEAIVICSTLIKLTSEIFKTLWGNMFRKSRTVNVSLRLDPNQYILIYRPRFNTCTNCIDWIPLLP